MKYLGMMFLIPAGKGGCSLSQVTIVVTLKPSINLTYDETYKLWSGPLSSYEYGRWEIEE